VTTRGAPRRGGTALALGLAATLAAADAAAASLEVLDSAGDRLLAVDLPADGRWCLVWNHSVTGIEVSDCFRADPDGMVLESSRQPDFAAGLGDLPDEGRVRSFGAGGYLIEGLARPVPEAGLALRRGGPAVAHRVRIGDTVLALPPGPRGERLTVRPGRSMGMAPAGASPHLALPNQRVRRGCTLHPAAGASGSPEG
jgi:hypothetical protein